MKELRWSELSFAFWEAMVREHYRGPQFEVPTYEWDLVYACAF